MATDAHGAEPWFWLAVVQREHVLRAVALGIAQVNHGSKAGMQRMRPGDGVAYYSPKTAYPEGDPLREFTAIGVVDEGEPWQAEDGDVRPWRRRVLYVEGIRPAPIGSLLDVLELTRGRANWGIILRRGLVELSGHDFAHIAEAMGADAIATLDG